MVAALAVAAGAVSACGSSRHAAGGGDATSATTAGAITQPPGAPAPTTGVPGAPPSTDGSGGIAIGDAPNSAMDPIANLPLTAVANATSGLHDGQTVTVHVTPTAGSKIFGAEARLCTSSAPVTNSADFAPTQGGLCIAHPLSTGSDARLEVAGQAPYQSLDVPFRVGVGTDTYTRSDGTPVSITCSRTSPCALVLKLEVPNGFGFQTFPLTYA